jgi:hypothetical protein
MGEVNYCALRMSKRAQRRSPSGKDLKVPAERKGSHHGEPAILEADLSAPVRPSGHCSPDASLTETS